MFFLNVPHLITPQDNLMRIFSGVPFLVPMFHETPFSLVVFLLLINDLPGDIIYKIAIYNDDATLDYKYVTYCRKKDHPNLHFQPHFDVPNLA